MTAREGEGSASPPQTPRSPTARADVLILNPKNSRARHTLDLSFHGLFARASNLVQRIRGAIVQLIAIIFEHN